MSWGWRGTCWVWTFPGCVSFAGIFMVLRLDGSLHRSPGLSKSSSRKLSNYTAWVADGSSGDFSGHPHFCSCSRRATKSHLISRWGTRLVLRTSQHVSKDEALTTDSAADAFRGYVGPGGNNIGSMGKKCSPFQSSINSSDSFSMRKYQFGAVCL